MELIALNRDSREFFVGDLDPSVVDVLVEFGTYPQPLLGGDAADELDDDLARQQRPAAPVVVMWQNIRCSILFHLLVPGGK